MRNLILILGCLVSFRAAALHEINLSETQLHGLFVDAYQFTEAQQTKSGYPEIDFDVESVLKLPNLRIGVSYPLREFNVTLIGIRCVGLNGQPETDYQCQVKVKYCPIMYSNSAEIKNVNFIRENDKFKTVFEVKDIHSKPTCP